MDKFLKMFLMTKIFPILRPIELVTLAGFGIIQDMEPMRTSWI